MGTFSIKPACLICALFCVGAASAWGDQTTAQEDAQRIHDNGSNNSLNESYGNALHALDNFYQLNLPGAISHGIKAYGQYRNSQTMDNLRDKNHQNAGMMGSVGSGGVSDSSVTGDAKFVSPYARLDTKFLYEGSTGEVAAKLERLSGLSRAQMFKMAVDLHANSKSPSDPDFIPWAMKSYKDLVAKVPNDNFRAGLEAFGNIAEKGIGSGMAKSVLAQFTSSAQAPAVMVAAAPAAPVPAAKERAPASVAAPSAPAVAAPEENPLANSLGFSERGSATTGVDGSLLGLDRISSDPVDGFLGEALKEENSPSIFQKVSSKIREMNARQHLGRPVALAGGV